MNKEEESKENLLEETLNFLEIYDKTPEDVEWCSISKRSWFSWEVFAKLAKETFYDSSYGESYIQDLHIVGDDWFLERWENDGSEGWEYKKRLIKPKKFHTPKTLFKKR